MLPLPGRFFLFLSFLVLVFGFFGGARVQANLQRVPSSFTSTKLPTRQLAFVMFHYSSHTSHLDGIVTHCSFTNKRKINFSFPLLSNIALCFGIINVWSFFSPFEMNEPPFKKRMFSYVFMCFTCV